jgi:hypothetical protein
VILDDVINVKELHLKLEEVMDELLAADFMEEKVEEMAEQVKVLYSYCCKLELI